MNTALHAKHIPTLAGIALFALLAATGQDVLARQPSAGTPALLATNAPAAERSAVAAAPFREPPVLWRTHIGAQLAQMLAAPSKSVRAESMQLVIQLARQYGSRVDLEATVPALLWTYEWDTDKANRILAVAALHAIGSPAGMDQLARLVDGERSRLVRRITYAALTDRHAPN